MPVVDVPQHGLVQFPDEMSDEEISSAIQSNYPDVAPKPETKTVSSSLVDPHIVSDSGEVGKLSEPKTLVQQGVLTRADTGYKGPLTPLVRPSKYTHPQDIYEGLHNVLVDAASAATAPITPLLGIASEIKALSPATKAVLAGMGVKGLYDIANAPAPTTIGERVEQTGDALLNAAMLVPGIKALGGEKPSIVTKADEIAPLAPLTAEALKQTAQETPNANSIRTDEGRVHPQGDVVQGSQEKSSENIQQPAKTGTETGGSTQRLDPKLESDIARYNELNDKRNQMLASGDAMLPDASNFTPEYMDTWKELEQIKNRHGGMPPVEEATPEPQAIGMGGALAEGEPQKPSLAGLTDSLKTLAESSTESKPSEAFNLGQKYAALKDSVSSAAEGLKAAGQYLKLRLEGKPVVTDFKRALGERHLDLSESVQNARKFVETSEKAVPDKLTQEAISNWIDTGGDNALLRQAEAETKARYQKGYEAARNLTPEQKTVAENVKNYFESRLQDAQDAGILEAGIEDYIHRIYEKDSPWKQGVIAELRSGVFTGKPDFAKQRAFQYDFEAEKSGYKPIKSFIKRITAYDLSLNKAIADRKLVKSMMDIKMKDGRPMIDVGGVGIEVPKEGVTEATLIKPSFKLEDTETPANNRADYKAYDYPALRKWKWVAKDANGNPIFVQGDVLIHPDAIKDVKSLFERSAIRQNPVGRAALNIGSAVKQTMLDISGFHPVQITVHGWEHRTDVPFSKTFSKVMGRDAKEIDFQDPDTRGLIKGGLVVGDTRGYELFSEGLTGSSLTRHIPGLGPKLQAYNEWLFNDYIPRLKVATGLHALERNRQRFKNLSEEELYHLTANQMNAAFGELNYEMLGRSKTTQDVLRLALLAPDFLEARGRFAAQSVTKYGKEQFQALALGAATLYITARIINKLLDGEYHFESKNAFSVVYNKHAYSLRTVQGDLLHLATDPGKFTYNRLNPLYGRTGFEFLTGRDYFGRKRDYPEQAKDLASTVVPISLRGVVNPKEQKLWESFINAFGVTERRNTSNETINTLVEKFKKDHNVRSEPGEFIYDPDKDPYRTVKQAATFDSVDATAKSIADTVAKGQVTEDQLRKHFDQYGKRPFTGSKSNDDKMKSGLSADNQKIFDDARRERKEVSQRFKEAYRLYLQQKENK